MDHPSHRELRSGFSLVGQAVRGRWPEILPALGIDPSFLTGRHGPCPGCGGKDRYRFDDRAGAGSFICSGGGAGAVAGDGFGLLCHVYGWAPSEALRRVAELALPGTRSCCELSPMPAAVLASVPAKELRRWSAQAQSIWARSLPLRGTPGEAYFLGRVCVLPPEDGDLRFLAPRDHHPPTLVARITDAVSAEPLTLHFTPLTDAGRGKRKLLAGHAKAGGVVRLWPDEAVTYGLGIAEGIETALSLAHAYQPVWAAVDSGNLARLPVLAGIESLIIAQDGDAAGQRASTALAKRWHAAGREVAIIASQPGQDLNDDVREVAA